MDAKINFNEIGVNKEVCSYPLGSMNIIVQSIPDNEEGNLIVSIYHPRKNNVYQNDEISYDNKDNLIKFLRDSAARHKIMAKLLEMQAEELEKTAKIETMCYYPDGPTD